MTVASICFANQWTGFYMIGTSIMKELNMTGNTLPILTGKTL